MQIKNTENNFGIVAIFFHWLMAVLIIGLLTVGLYMVSLPSGLLQSRLYGLHKEFGVLVLFLVILRVIWRLINTVPSLDTLPSLEKIAAKSMHLALYLFMFVMPISGWLMSSSAGHPVSFFGLFTLPDLIMANKSNAKLFNAIHEWVAYMLIGALIVHTIAALKHHYINKDTILKRIL